MRFESRACRLRKVFMAVSSQRKHNLPLLCATCVHVLDRVRLGKTNVLWPLGTVFLVRAEEQWGVRGEQGVYQVLC